MSSFSFGSSIGEANKPSNLYNDWSIEEEEDVFPNIVLSGDTQKNFSSDEYDHLDDNYKYSQATKQQQSIYQPYSYYYQQPLELPSYNADIDAMGQSLQPSSPPRLSANMFHQQLNSVPKIAMDKKATKQKCQDLYGVSNATFKSNSSYVSMRDQLGLDNRHSTEALIEKFQFIANLPIRDLQALGTKKEFIHLAKEHKRVMGLGKNVWTREVADNFRFAMQAFSKKNVPKKKNGTIVQNKKKYTHVELLTKFYKEYNPNNICKIGFLLRKYNGRENLLFSNLEKRYQVSNYFSKFVLTRRNMIWKR
jgi:hypothetical protein